MKFQETSLKGNYLIDLDKYEDERGFFARNFCKKEFLNYGLNTNWVQINSSMNYQSGTLRGLHFQTKKAQGKLVSVLKGKILDIAVDLRKNSKTFGKYFKIIIELKRQRHWILKKTYCGEYISVL
jgi:dTDP-4-dehydrorhamnose 3,5-epimerase